MSGYLIDTDWIVDALHGRPETVATLLELAPAGRSISIISYGELYEGAHDARDQATALAGLTDFLNSKDILPLTISIMEAFAVLRGSLAKQVRQQVGDMDLLIAATALHDDLVLMTRNLRDFRQIPGVRLFSAP